MMASKLTLLRSGGSVTCGLNREDCTLKVFGSRGWGLAQGVGVEGPE